MRKLGEIITTPTGAAVAVGMLAYSSDAEGARFSVRTSVPAINGGAKLFNGTRELATFPAAKGKTLIEATEWLRSEVRNWQFREASGSGWVDKTAAGRPRSLADQIKQAYQIRQNVLAGARASMLSESTTYAVMRDAFGIKSLAKIKAEVRLGDPAKGIAPLTGEAAQKEVLRRLINIDTSTKFYEACFAAGTLVHTKEGLKPIEQIKVGDLVLSKHESGEGERAYKRVTKTFVHEDRAVILVVVGGMQPDGTSRLHRFAVTPEHPFWVQGKGWKAVGTLIGSVMKPTKFEIIANENPALQGHLPLMVTSNSGTAWTPLAPKDFSLGGRDLDLRTMESSEKIECFQFKTVKSAGRAKPEHFYKTTVYNFEVEDFHTYYVGEVGVWVHNKNIGVKPGVGGGAPWRCPGQSPESCPNCISPFKSTPLSIAR